MIFAHERSSLWYDFDEMILFDSCGYVEISFISRVICSITIALVFSLAVRTFLLSLQLKSLYFSLAILFSSSSSTWLVCNSSFMISCSRASLLSPYTFMQNKFACIRYRLIWKSSLSRLTSAGALKQNSKTVNVLSQEILFSPPVLSISVARRTIDPRQSRPSCNPVAPCWYCYRRASSLCSPKQSMSTVTWNVMTCAMCNVTVW